MFLDGKKVPAVSWTWQEGRYWDLWMVVHFLSGAILGFAALLLSISFWPALIIAIVLMVLFEAFEEGFGIAEEVIENHILDVVFGIPGFLLFYSVLPEFAGNGEVLLAGVIITFINAILAFLGWRAHIRRKYKQRKPLT